MEENIVNNVRILYTLGFFIMDGDKPKTQYKASSDIIGSFKKCIPQPVAINYIFEEPCEKDYIMVSFHRNGTCAMRIPHREEIEEYENSMR